MWTCMLVNNLNTHENGDIIETFFFLIHVSQTGILGIQFTYGCTAKLSLTYSYLYI